MLYSIKTKSGGWNVPDKGIHVECGLWRCCGPSQPLSFASGSNQVGALALAWVVQIWAHKVLQLSHRSFIFFFGKYLCGLDVWNGGHDKLLRGMDFIGKLIRGSQGTRKSF